MPPTSSQAGGSAGKYNQAAHAAAQTRVLPAGSTSPSHGPAESSSLTPGPPPQPPSQPQCLGLPHQPHHTPHRVGKDTEPLRGHALSGVRRRAARPKRPPPTSLHLPAQCCEKK